MRIDNILDEILGEVIAFVWRYPGPLLLAVLILIMVALNLPTCHGSIK